MKRVFQALNFFYCFLSLFRLLSFHFQSLFSSSFYHLSIICSSFIPFSLYPFLFHFSCPPFIVSSLIFAILLSLVTPISFLPCKQAFCEAASQLQSSLPPLSLGVIIDGSLISDKQFKAVNSKVCGGLYPLKTYKIPFYAIVESHLHYVIRGSLSKTTLDTRQRRHKSRISTRRKNVEAEKFPAI